MDHLKSKQRFTISKYWEDCAADDLINNHGIPLIDSTEYDDCVEKTDRWIKGKSQKLYRIALKSRLDKKGKLLEKGDILVSLYDKFYGLDDPRTSKGRDVLYEYFFYDSVIKNQHRIVNGKIIHNMCCDLHQEALNNNCYDDLYPQDRGRGYLLLESKKYQGCEIRLHYDAEKFFPKILVFINPKCLKKGSEIKYYNFNY